MSEKSLREVMSEQELKSASRLLCSAINTFGSGQHPWADEANVGLFHAPYVVTVLKKAVTHVANESTAAQVQHLIQKLSLRP